MKAIYDANDEKNEKNEKNDPVITCEEPVDNVPDKNDLRTVNACIKMIKRVQGIPGFGLDIFNDCIGAMIAARSMVFDEFVDWEAAAK